MAEDYSSNKRKQKLFSSVCQGFLRKLSNEIMYNDYMFKIPERLGYLHIGAKPKRAANRKPINWQETRRLGRTIYLLNNHSNGKIYSWAWSNYDRYTHGELVRMYHFTPARNVTRSLAKHIFACAADPHRKNYTSRYELFKKLDKKFYFRMSDNIDELVAKAQ